MGTVNVFVFPAIWVRLHPDFITQALGYSVNYSGNKVTAHPLWNSKSEGARRPIDTSDVRSWSVYGSDCVCRHFMGFVMQSFLKHVTCPEEGCMTSFTKIMQFIFKVVLWSNFTPCFLGVSHRMKNKNAIYCLQISAVGRYLCLK